jgi:iron complex outermembrane recepter protein
VKLYIAKLRVSTAIVIGLWSGASIAQVAAQGATAPEHQGSTELESGDIVVTAQKRETALQKTPLAITAVGGGTLDARGINSPVDLAASVPGANFSTNGGALSITIRGVGSDGLSQPKDDPSVAAHLDGVYLARPVSLVAALYDVERLEILRGPQGTLYGRNATGGALNIITKLPTSDFGVQGNASYGNYDAVQVRGVVNVPLGEGLGLRAVGLYNRHDGYSKQLNPAFKDGDDADDLSGRATLLWEPSSKFTVTLRANLYHSKGIGPTRTLLDTQELQGVSDANGVGYGSVTGAIIVDRCALAGYPEACTDPRAIATVFPQFQEVKSNTYSGTLQWSVSDAITVKSITGYTDFRQDKRSASRPFQPLNANQTFNYVTTSETWTEEVNVNYDDGDRLTAVVGGFYLKDDGTNNFVNVAANPLQVVSVISDQFTGARSLAAFGEVNFKITPTVTLTGGLRYTHEKKSGSSLSVINIPFRPTLTIPQPEQEVTFSSTNFKIGMDWRVTDTVFAYVNYSTAFKSGGVNTGVPINQTYDAERLRALQGGIKTDWFDRKVRFNLDAYYYKYRNPQITQVLGVSLETQNASDATVKGAEAVLELRPSQGLILSAQASYADSKYGSALISDILDLDAFGQTVFGRIQIGGNPLRFTPKWTFGASAAYEFPVSDWVDINARADYLWQDNATTRPQNLPIDRIQQYSTLNATLRASFNDKHYYVELFGRNLTNPTVVSARFVNPLHLAEYRAPRTYGVTLGFAFN